jgi:hypothetical protein
MHRIALIVLTVLTVVITTLAASGGARAQAPADSPPPTELPAAPVPVAPPPTAAPPPAAPLPSDPNPAAAPSPSRTFGTRGVVEIGGSVGVSYDYFVDGKDSFLSLDLSVYAGWFLTRHLVLGAYLSLPYSQYWGSGSEDNDYWRIAPGVVLAPGFAIGLGGNRTFFFADLLLGIHGVKQDGAYSGYHGELGAEVGVKVVVGSNYLLRFGLRPAYFLGKLTAEGSTYEADIKQFNLMLRLGFSGFL